MVVVHAHITAVLGFDDYDAFIEHQASQHHHVIARAIEPVDAAVLSSRSDQYRERYPLTPAAWWGAAT